MRRSKVSVRPVALVIAAISLACVPESVRPNIVLISLDTLRADHLGVYGYERNTSPNLDSFAARGIVFRDHYAQAPHTVPSHISMLTGLFPSVAGVWDHGALLDPSVPVLPEILKDAGYATAAFVELPGGTYERGFDIYEGLGHEESTLRETSYLEVLREFVESDSELPFFLFIHTYAVHLPYTPPQEFADKYWDGYDGDLGKDIYGPTINAFNSGRREMSAEDLQHIISMYDAEIAALDHDVGEIVDIFSSRGLLDNTVVAIVSDHGEEFGEHGVVAAHAYSLREQLIRTPLIMFGAGLPAGIEVDLPSRNVDVAPTLLKLASADTPKRMQGVDLSSLWEGTESEPRIVVAEKEEYRVFVVDGLKYYTNNGALFYLRDDPLEKSDLRGQRPDTVVEFERLAAGWQVYLQGSKRGIAGADEGQLTPEEVRRLKTLGYLR